VLQKALPEERGEMPRFKVKVELHNYSDLSDKATEVWFPIDVEDDGSGETIENLAVYKLRDMIDEERRVSAIEQGLPKGAEGDAVYINKAGNKKYVGRALLGHVKRVK
jgi:hypothetical protein